MPIAWSTARRKLIEIPWENSVSSLASTSNLTAAIEIAIKGTRYWEAVSLRLPNNDSDQKSSSTYLKCMAYDVRFWPDGLLQFGGRHQIALSRCIATTQKSKGIGSRQGGSRKPRVIFESGDDTAIASMGTAPTEAHMSWLILMFAGLFEIAWAIGLKFTNGFSRLWPTVGTAASMLASVALLGVAMRDLPVGTAYAVWTGIGAIGTAILGILLFGDSASPGRLACLAMIACGIVGLKVFSGS